MKANGYWATMAPVMVQMAFLGVSKEGWDREIRSEQMSRKFVEDCWADGPEKTSELEEHDMVANLIRQYREIAPTNAERHYNSLSFFGKLKHNILQMWKKT